MSERSGLPATAAIHATVAVSMLRALLAYLVERGHARETLIRSARLDAADLNYPGRRIDGRCFIDLMRYGIELTGNPLLGLEFGMAADTSRWGTLGRLLRQCDTLGQALAYQRRYAHLVNAIGEGRLAIHDGDCALVWQSRITRMPALAEEALAAWVHFARWAGGRAEAPLAVYLAHRPQGDPAVYRAFFGCEVAFEQADSAIVFDPALLSRPFACREANAETTAGLHGRIERDDADDRARTLVATLDDWLALHLEPGVPDLATAAASMGLGGRQLQQHLHAAGTHYRARIAAVRRRQAERYLSQPGLSVGDIAIRLGFSEQSAFQRAFQRWYGITPLRWRRQQGPNATLRSERLP
ncbi:AraC family transcriptional regulator [Salinisphaera sp. T31B1]|uniref:AraC family transcriptional regulator n=1 Tax=Salinisphaera sp. T31B1 TaxID=727963 RepID=UPI00333E9AC2